jgi:ferritin-like metal-binding protein YciE
LRPARIAARHELDRTPAERRIPDFVSGSSRAPPGRIRARKKDEGGLMNLNSFRDMYVAEVDELVAAEREFCALLPRLAASATDADLKKELNAQLAQVRHHIEDLDAVRQQYQSAPRDHGDRSMQALVREAERWKSKLPAPELEGAALIDSTQRILHYEIAAYGTATAYAGMLGFCEDMNALHSILEQKKAMDRALTDLAERTINLNAAIAYA